jgi:hypothetical protein
VYVISDPNVVSNPVSSLPEDTFSTDTSIASPEEPGPISLHLTASSTVEEDGPTLSEEVGPIPSLKIGPTLLQGANSASNSSSFVSLSQSMSSYVDTLQSDSDNIEHWSHLPLPYAHASKLIKPHYDNIGRLFAERGSSNKYAIVDIVTSSAPQFHDTICFKFYDTSIFPSPPSLDDLYEY